MAEDEVEQMENEALMAGLTGKRDSGKSQKRKDRQQRRAERRKLKAEKLKSGKLKDGTTEAAAVSGNGDVQQVKKSKSLPGFLAKHSAEICSWLRAYLTLRMRSDDAGIEWIREMSAEERKAWIDEHVAVSEFIDAVAALKAK